FRSILIVTLPLPLAVLVSFLTMYYTGITSNIMSLAGIAIAIGVLVDAAIVVTENAFRYVEQRGVDTGDRAAVMRAVQDSARLVGRPVFFSMAIIVLAFIPVFALTGQEGKLFHPLAFTETIVHLKPRDQWRAGMTLDRIRSELSAAAELPGVTIIWTMPIINRIDMLSTGVRSEVGVKIYGSDLPMLEQTARQVADVLRTVPGAANVYPEPLTSSQYLNVRVDRERAARYGLTVSAVQDVIRTAIGERNLTLTLEGRQRFPVRVRYGSEHRS